MIIKKTGIVTYYDSKIRTLTEKDGEKNGAGATSSFHSADDFASVLEFDDEKGVRNFKDWLRGNASDDSRRLVKRSVYYSPEVFVKTYTQRKDKIFNCSKSTVVLEWLLKDHEEFVNEYGNDDSFFVRYLLEGWTEDEKQPENDARIDELESLVATLSEKLKRTSEARENLFNASMNMSDEIKDLREKVEHYRTESENYYKNLNEASEKLESTSHEFEEFKAKTAKETEVRLAKEKAEAEQGIGRRRKFTRFFREAWFLVVPLILVIVASGIDMAVVFMDIFPNKLSSIFLSVVFSSVVLVFTFNSQKNGKYFAYAFAVLEALINAVYFEFIPAGMAVFTAKLCATVGLPIALVAYANLFTDYTKVD